MTPSRDALASAASGSGEKEVPVRAGMIGLGLVAALGMLAGSAVTVTAQEGAASTAPEGDEAGWPRIERGVVYGADDPEKQFMHFFRLEPREAPRPAVLLFHGGGLVDGSPDDVMFMAPFFTERGYVTFLPGYRTFDPETGANPWPAQLEDAQKAVRWVRAHADEFGVDPERVCAGGHSSGGHLAAMLGVAEADAAADPDLGGQSSRVACSVTLAGDGDLLVPLLDEIEVQNFAQLLGGSPEDRPELYEAASPAHNVDGETVPFLVIHGKDDETVDVQSARNLLDALTAAGREVTYAERPKTHGSLLSDDLTWALIDVFLADRLSPAR